MLESLNASNGTPNESGNITLRGIYIYIYIYIYIGLREAFAYHMFRPNMGLIDDDLFSAVTCCKQKCLMCKIKVVSCHRLFFSYIFRKNVFIIVSCLVFFYALICFYIHTRFIGAHFVVNQ
jgi:hypothetical protein